MEIQTEALSKNPPLKPPRDERETAANASSQASLVNGRLTLEAFSQLAGMLAGLPFVKVVVDRHKGDIHFINNARYKFHSDYIAECVLGISAAELDKDLDGFNRGVYLSPDRRFYLGIVSLNRRAERRFFTLETVEIDNMDEAMLRYFHGFVKMNLDASIPLLFKPASHLQETMVSRIDPIALPRILSHELFATAGFVPLNAGAATGRLRVFCEEAGYRAVKNTLEWYDILVMPRVPDDIPRIAGVINANHTTPLSHTNVLATGWRIPNAIQIGVLDEIAAKQLDGQWVRYSVDMDASRITLEKINRPAEIPQRPSWSIQRIRLEEPETANTPIVGLDRLRMSDRFRYGTKAANLGELFHILAGGSERMLGFYKVRRPPRANLLPYLARHLGLPEDTHAAALAAAALDFLRAKIRIPRGIAIPFSVQQTVLEGSPKVQQALGKLKMALELDSREVDAVCVQLQQMIRAIRIPDRIRDYIDSEIAASLGGVSSFVVRSSSNAEDLENFSAAGMYESIIHVTTAEKLFQAVKDVWASQLSPRSVRFVHQAGISLDDCYMGVIVQEEAKADIGGVLVTTNPMNRGDFRNVYVNVSAKSVGSVVHGEELPFQYLYNSVEGGGRTLSIGDAKEDLGDDRKSLLQDLAFAGRLFQAHFSRDYTFAMPLDVEWVAGPDEEALASPGDKAPPVLKIVQLRPYSK